MSKVTIEIEKTTLAEMVIMVRTEMLKPMGKLRYAFLRDFMESAGVNEETIPSFREKKGWL